MGENMQNWGHKARWTRHILESKKEQCKEYNLEISKAIREFGADDFEVEKLCDCLIEHMDKLEQFFIQEYNTLHPNGYNMTEGGTNGSKHCRAANEKSSAKRKETVRKKIEQGISPNAPSTSTVYEKETEYNEYSIKSEHIKPIMQENFILGYYVDGLNDFHGNPIPKRVFNKHTNFTNVQHATRFIQLVEEKNNNRESVADWLTIELPWNTKDSKIPNHIRKQSYKGHDSGYRVDYFIKYDENKKQIVETKCFTSKKLTMEQKLQLAIDYVAKLDEKYKKNQNKNDEETEDDDTTAETSSS
jgi:hypothetical protein